MRIFLLITTLLLALAVPATAVERIGLLKPDGTFPVGQRTLHLTDTSRADHWMPDQRRELMVSLWYPAFPLGTPAQYMTAAESAATVKGLKLDLPDDALQRLKVHSRQAAPALPSGRGWPLVVLSPGMGNTRATLTTLAEQLASKGFVVAGIDHAYEAYNVEFPGGRLLQCQACQSAGKPYQAAMDNRAQDVKFVLDEVLKRHSPRVDASRIGMAGHSMGGGATVHALATDARIKAGVNMDGPFYPVVDIPKPLALFTSPVGEEEFGTEWDAAWPQLTGWKERRYLAESGHSSSNDNGYLAIALGQKDKIPANTWSRLYGTGDTVEWVRFFRTYLTEFFQSRL
ncbi:alpha/beta hydrolase [Kibdelosporangium philippinense]|uniref:Alpha/beta hydrolase n=1 Tax=Kibdelosporangium philippinense TaxID=211113 RepID=A0ABS8Z444_9PSEU|nr:alpha/beta hydrolase [Kibdelosporangium philippinense]MCE7001704.1 alpha/beta hydrolase [Kibdelosporangium philippinense]